MKTKKNKYDPKIKTVRYVELIDQNKIWLILNSALKMCKLPWHAAKNSILIIYCSIFKYLKFRH